MNDLDHIFTTNFILQNLYIIEYVNQYECNMNINFGVCLPATSDVDFGSSLEYVLEAERLGYDSVWVADHWFISLEAFTALTAFAMKTQKVKLGTAVIDANRRPPAILAHITSTLDTISNGRLILGISSGIWNEKSYGYTVKNKVSRFKETVEVLKKFWTENEIEYHGEYYDFEGGAIGPKPLQKPHPPIWINGFGPRMKTIAGELADGFVTQHCPPKIFEEEYKIVKNSAKKAGKDPEKLVAAFMAPFALGDTYDQAYSYVKERGRRTVFNFGKPPHNFAERMGYGGPWEKLEDVPDEAVDQCFLFGTADDCISKIEKFAKKGVNYFVPLPLYPTDRKTLKVFAEEVVAYFKDN